MKKSEIVWMIILALGMLAFCWLIASAIAETRDALADLNSGTMRLIQLNNRSDLNKDGVINMKDFAIWSADYSESQSIRKEQYLKLHPPKLEPNIPEQKVYGADFNDPCFVNYYLEN